MVNIGDYWEANIDGELRLVQIQGIYKYITRPRTPEEIQRYMDENDGEEPHDEYWVWEKGAWLYGSWEEGMGDIAKDPNARLKVYYEDYTEDYIYPSQLITRVPDPPPEVEPFIPESEEEGDLTQEEAENMEPETKSNAVAWGVGIAAIVLFWDEVLLLFLATR